MTPDQFITSARKLCEPELCENEYLSEAEVALAQALDMIEVKVQENSYLLRFKRNTEAMLHLIGEDVAFMGSDWSDEVETKGYISECYLGSVGCLMMNDTFYYASSDAERVPYDDWSRIKEIYDEWGQDGLIAWVALRRGHDPQIPQNVTNKFKAAKKALAEIEQIAGGKE